MLHLVFRRTRHSLAAGLALLALGGGDARESQSGNPAASIDVQGIGPKVGEPLPDFTLRDQRGDAHSLKSLLGPSGAVIVFFRSADW